MSDFQWILNCSAPDSVQQISHLQFRNNNCVCNNFFPFVSLLFGGENIIKLHQPCNRNISPLTSAIFQWKESTDSQVLEYLGPAGEQHPNTTHWSRFPRASASHSCEWWGHSYNSFIIPERLNRLSKVRLWQTEAWNTDWCCPTLKVRDIYT